MQGVRSTCRCSEADSETASSISAFSSRAASSSACSFESLPEAVTWCRSYIHTYIYVGFDMYGTATCVHGAVLPCVYAYTYMYMLYV